MQAKAASRTGLFQALGLTGEKMGAWGVGSFANDDAADFLADVTDGEGLGPVHEIFAAVLASDEYVEAPDASQAIAAVEIVVAALGRPTDAAQQEDELVEWISRVKPAANTDLVRQAAQVLDRIISPGSELFELWEEADEITEWKEIITALRSQLQV